MVVRAISQRLSPSVAAQLAFPSGVFGRLVLPILDRVNGSLMDGAVNVLAPAPGDRVADVGCDGGRGVRRLLEAVGPAGVVHAVDPSQTAVARLRRGRRAAVAAGRLTVDRATMNALPYPDSCLDGVLSTNTVYYISDIQAAFAEVKRVLKPGGTFVLGVGDPGYMGRLPIAGHGPILRPINTIVDLVTAAGFTVNIHARLDDTEDAFHVIAATRA